ncbi:MAG TPA: outer membrane beta-barrel protein [Bryobacteraceae bacterium]|nr:outer membrane beta-barrel protein [Bryobacteraceae bacterium]
MTKPLIVLALTALAAVAQPIGIGIKGGLPFNDLFEAENPAVETETKRYIVGPMIEVRLPAGFAIEADALYSRANFSSVLSGAGSIITAPFNTNSWEFPVLLKKKFGGADAVAASARPYIGAGPSFRRLSGLSNIGSFITGNRSGEVDRNSTGFVVGGGVEIRALFVKIAPEVRFTYWGTDHFTEGLANVFKTNKAQGQFLIGLYF